MRLLLLSLVLLSNILFTQSDSLVEVNDSTIDNSIQVGESESNVNKSNRYVNPKLATIYSTVLPGLGQLYVKKNWYFKIPIIYAGFGTFAFTINHNSKGYIRYRDEYRLRSNDENYTPSGELAVLNDAAVKNKRDDFRRLRDLNYALVVVWYGFNILDATVSAHFSQFDVGDDLTLKLTPYQNLSFDNSIESGLSLKLKF